MSTNGSLPVGTDQFAYQLMHQLSYLQAAPGGVPQAEQQQQQYMEPHAMQHALNAAALSGDAGQNPLAAHLTQIAVMQQAHAQAALRGVALRPDLLAQLQAQQAKQHPYAALANNNIFGSLLLNTSVVNGLTAPDKTAPTSAAAPAPAPVPTIDPARLNSLLLANQLQRFASGPNAAGAPTISQTNTDDLRQLFAPQHLAALNQHPLFPPASMLSAESLALLSGSLPASAWHSPTAVAAAAVAAAANANANASANANANASSRDSDKKPSAPTKSTPVPVNCGLDEQLSRRTPQHTNHHLNNNNNATPGIKPEATVRGASDSSLGRRSPKPARRLAAEAGLPNGIKTEDDSHQSHAEPLNLAAVKREALPDPSDASERQRRLFTENIAQAHQLAPIAPGSLYPQHSMLHLGFFPVPLPPPGASQRLPAPILDWNCSPSANRKREAETSGETLQRSSGVSPDQLDAKKPRMGDAMAANIAPLITPLSVATYEMFLPRNGTNANGTLPPLPATSAPKAAASSPAGSSNSSTLVAPAVADANNPPGRAAESGSTSSASTQPCTSPKHPGKLKKNWLDRHETAGVEPPAKPSQHSPATPVRTVIPNGSLTQTTQPIRPTPVAEPQSPPSDVGKSSESARGAVRGAVATQKAPGDPFLQNAPCYETAPKLFKCRECRVTSDKRLDNLFCRFCAFRKLRYNQKGQLIPAGFSTVHDADAKDIQLWRMPQHDVKLTRECAAYILDRLGAVFCHMVTAEKAAVQQLLSRLPPNSAASQQSGNRRLVVAGDLQAQVGIRSCIGFDTMVEIPWKRAVQSVREMCDACKTTLFNMHWVCQKCGYVVCLECYNARVERPCGTPTESTSELLGNGAVAATNRTWLTCSVTRKQHQPSSLVLTQVIPADALWSLAQRLHAVAERCQLRRVALDCRCYDNSACRALALACQRGATSASPAASQPDAYAYADEQETDESPSSSAPSSARRTPQTVLPSNGTSSAPTAADGGMDALSLLANVATAMPKQLGAPQAAPMRNVTLQNVIDSVVNECVRDSESDAPASAPVPAPPNSLAVARALLTSPKQCGLGSVAALRNGLCDDACVFDSAKLSASFSAVAHSWLCNGRVLHLHDSTSANNLDAFQRVWRFGKPVLVSGCHRASQKDLWSPRTFTKEHGTVQAELINCRTGLPLPSTLSLRSFWDGFENVRKRTNRDSHGEPLILKLKDWPASDDFQDVLPRQYRDLLAVLPLAEYTHRNGMLNLAARLPDFFVRPDLGPKLYSAYGTSRNPAVGSTNLHIDISDAVNVLMHVAVEGNEETELAMRYLDTNPHLDAESLERVRSQKLVHGAIWHLFDARDAPKLRAFLQRVATEKNTPTGSGSSSSGSNASDVDHDPIHDQQTYLDSEALGRLRREYGVLPYTLLQCVGDAIFIPAGSPHQVKNLQSCVKVALDFVSAEQVTECVHLTGEFRRLSKKHANHEDKLQIKNMIYHAVKDCVAVLENVTGAAN